MSHIKRIALICFSVLVLYFAFSVLAFASDETAEQPQADTVVTTETVETQTSETTEDPFEAQLMDPTFPTGTYIIPMDDKQADVVETFGFVQEMLDGGSTVYRIIGPPDPICVTTTEPGGDVYAGGPFLILQTEQTNVTNVSNQFPAVTVDTLLESVTSDRVYQMNEPTRILLIWGAFGDSAVTLQGMGLDYTQVTLADIQANQSLIYNYDVVIDDCPGNIGYVSEDINTLFADFVSQGGEMIFSDIALLDLETAFPGYVHVTDNEEGAWTFLQHNNGDFISQYAGPNPVEVYTEGGGNIVDEILDQSVRILMDSDAYGEGPDYRVGAFYFPFGQGIVEGFAFHPGDQTENGYPLAQRMVSILIGNKLIHSGFTETVTDTAATTQLPYTGADEHLPLKHRRIPKDAPAYLLLAIGILLIGISRSRIIQTK